MRAMTATFVFLAATASAESLYQRGERLVREGRQLIASGQAKVKEGERLLALHRAKQATVATARGLAVAAQRRVFEMQARAKSELSIGRSEERLARRDIESAKRQLEQVAKKIRERQAEVARARDLQRMGRDEMAKGGHAAGRKLLDQGLQRERSIAFRIAELQRDQKKLHDLLLKAVERLRRADTRIFNAKAIEANLGLARKAAEAARRQAAEAEKAARH